MSHRRRPPRRSHRAPPPAAGWQAGWVETLRELAGHEKVVAIGEIGLDYYWDRSPRTMQHSAFVAQLALAAELKLPVIVHNREADGDVLRLLAESGLPARNPGVLHSFSSTWETAGAALEMGYYLGFTGPVTYKKADELRQVVAKAPLDRIVVETDAPFLPPQQHRGRRNEPAYVALVAEKVAEIRGMKPGLMDGMTTENAACLFGRRLVAGLSW
ncbi:MAG: TatD family hydrolase [Chloroflexi bacterium]|nr:TatD family hydrolase [Chloroflexota bacterium]